MGGERSLRESCASDRSNFQAHGPPQKRMICCRPAARMGDRRETYGPTGYIRQPLAFRGAGASRFVYFVHDKDLLPSSHSTSTMKGKKAIVSKFPTASTACKTCEMKLTAS